MARFTSLAHAPAETRQVLCSRFSHSLYVAPWSPPRDEALLPDQAVLELLDSVVFTRSRTLDTARKTYGRIRQAEPDVPTFESLCDDGWLRVSRGRVYSHTPHEVLRRHDDPLSRALLAMRLELSHVEADLSAVPPPTADLIDLHAQLRDEPQRVKRIPAQSPAWVAARLWERCCRRGPITIDTLVWWEDRWEMLDAPFFAPRAMLSTEHADAFIQIAMGTLNEPNVLLTWEQVARQRDRHREHVRKNPGVALADADSLPKTLVDRFVWLMHPWAFRGHDNFHLIARAPNFCSLLFAELNDPTQAHQSSLPLDRWIPLLTSRPELLAALHNRAQWAPALYADLCLSPACASLAVLWVSSRRNRSTGAYDRNIGQGFEAESRFTAFEDAIALVDHHLHKQSLPPAEVASLVRALHLQGAMGRAEHVADDRRLVTTLLAMLNGHPKDVLEDIVDALLNWKDQRLDGADAFAAALEVIASGLLTDTSHARRLIGRYLQIVQSDSAEYMMKLIDTRAAATLAEVASWTSGKVGRAFLHAIDIEELASAQTSTHGNRYRAVLQASRSLRAHVRMLARAIAGSIGEPSADLTAALTQSAQEGIFEEAGYHDPSYEAVVPARTVDIFASTFEAAPFGLPEGPIADDLALALDRLHTDLRPALMAALLRSREPAFFAALLSHAPAALRPAIDERIQALASPEAAGTIHSLTEMQLRITRMLDAGRLDSAQALMDEEAELATFGQVRGRDEVRLRSLLRLYYQKGQYEVLRTYAVPTATTPEASTARDIVTFYQGLAWMHGPDNSMAHAKELFSGLRRRHPGNTAYTNNYLAAAVSDILGSDIFGRIPDDRREAARLLWAESHAASDHYLAASGVDRDLFSLNLSLLALAMGDPFKALSLLEGIRTSTYDVAVSAYTAVALARMGRSGTALTTLNVIRHIPQDDPLLVAARAQIERGEAYAGTITVATDAVAHPNITQFLSMRPHDRAGILTPGPFPERTHAIAEVRDAVTGLQDLVPALRSGATRPREDDITSLGAKLLTAKAGMLGWGWNEQSRGGITDAGGMGERDLVLKFENTTYSVLEAVVIDRSIGTTWAKGELVSHYLKLHAYAQTSLFFHVVYSFVDHPEAIADFLRSDVSQHPPDGFSFVRHTELPSVGNVAPGFVAEYLRAQKEISVVFIVVDLRLKVEHAAAKAAASANPRPKGASQKKRKKPSSTDPS